MGDARIAIDIESLCNSIEKRLINPISLIAFYSLPVLSGWERGRGDTEKTLEFIGNMRNLQKFIGNH